MAAHIVADDPVPALSRLDRLDGQPVDFEAMGERFARAMREEQQFVSWWR
ncbi:hypothetical protein [Segeticoccus rhizosphaerae]|nr:hypothetical protein [Segeticoccus rhizosphaerae]